MASDVARKKLEPFTEEQKRRIHETLMSFLEGDEEDAREQVETLEYLKKALDENRHSTRKLFS
jgi:hypothetical protein